MDKFYMSMFVYVLESRENKMYTIDLSNKHKKNFIAFVEMVDGHIVAVASDTMKKLNKFKTDNLYNIANIWQYDKAGKIVLDI